MLKALSGATVIVLDVSDEKLELAKHVGADVTLISDESAAGKIRELTGGVGVDAVFDFVGANPTIATATAVAAMEADVTIVGIGGGSATIGFGSIAYDAAVRVPYWGSRSELIEVFELAKAGKVDVEVQPYSLDDAPKAYEDLHAGTIRGRAVIVP
jgi:propanol-preferring alcohol dehydrogenase